MANTPPPPRSNVPVRVNLFSDTQTKPSRAMRAAMMEAEVGDEQLGLDPTVNRLTERMAALLGKEAAMFLPSGTMCNEIAILVHCRPGDEILAHATAHILSAEGGAPAALAGVQITAVPGERGQFTPAALRSAIRAISRNSPPQRLVAVEQTSNLGGGCVWPLDTLAEVASLAHEHGLATHMDGARLLNATVASNSAAAAMVAGWDSVWLDFTKGLGAPLGAVLAGSAEFIDAAWRWKQRLGGSMRQAGICAAACLYALDHNVDRLADDHAHAHHLADRLAATPGLTVPSPETNLVYINTGDIPAAELAGRLREHGIMISVMGANLLRACTHLDVDTAGIDFAADAIRRVMGGDPQRRTA